MQRLLEWGAGGRRDINGYVGAFLEIAVQLRTSSRLRSVLSPFRPGPSRPFLSKRWNVEVEVE